MFRSWLVAVSLILAAISPSFAQQNTRDGAAVGGAAGAIIGGIIGHQNNETPEGAIIGGVVGAVAGGLAGRAKDQQMARDRYYQNQMYQQQQQINQMARRNVTIDDVIAMTRNGLSEQVIMNYVQTNGVNRQLNVSEIIALHQQGVSENVISAMQRAPIGSQTVQESSVQYRQAYQSPPTTVIVREHCHVPPPVIYQAAPPVFYYHRHW